MVFSDFSRLLCKPTHFSIALSKGAKTTTWIWNLHADAHDFDIQPTTKLITRKVFSSGNAHLSLVFFWLGALHFSGAYFANFSAFILDPKHCFSSAHLVSSLVGQDILNSDVGGYFQGIYTTAAFTQIHLKYASSASLIGTITCIAASYFSMHLLFITSIHHLPLLLGLASLSYCSHQIHISSPINRLLDSGVDPAVIPLPQDLLIGGTGFSIQLLCGGTLQMLSAHHFYLGIALIAAALSTSRSYTHIPTRLNYYSSHPNLPDGQLKHLCIHLLFVCSLYLCNASLSLSSIRLSYNPFFVLSSHEYSCFSSRWRRSSCINFHGTLYCITFYLKPSMSNYCPPILRRPLVRLTFFWSVYS
eukprot:TRINITY_DN1328_c0_g1_i25.p1 TRINITY_DN1328_c0_g1~~TRINITY_DN1328_c0_g1_i25.p1  ORF type:complete len:360 (+),score=-107.39 TRINITY_DN1328_c0_g1_i25:109-1188(+)